MQSVIYRLLPPLPLVPNIMCRQLVAIPTREQATRRGKRSSMRLTQSLQAARSMSEAVFTRRN
ncbi:hypothetical protein [Paenibacillus polymyxa]|uniref:hypothetical protein n=1 Tax=Paenibacillus polymyxa TaxID=1406 RepID=UPI003F492A97